MNRDGSTNQHSVGALVASLIVLAVLVLGGVYFLRNQPRANQSDNPPMILGDDPESVPSTQNPTLNSDEIPDISKDLGATDLAELESQIDADLQTIEANL